MNDEDWVQLLCSIISILVVAWVEEKKRFLAPRMRCRTSQLSSEAYVQELLNGHPRRFKEVLRMQKPTFLKLCDELRGAGLKRTLQISVEQQLAMFLQIVGHHHSNRNIQERFQHSGETVHRSIL